MLKYWELQYLMYFFLKHKRMAVELIEKLDYWAFLLEKIMHIG